MKDNSETDTEKDAAGPSFLQVMMSAFAAAFGVQTNANLDRDFSKGNPLAFIAAGLLFTVFFILSVMGLVMLALPD